MVLEIISVNFHRNKRLIFDNFNLKLAKSQIIILIGDNGVGKSSLLDLATGMLKPEKGEIKINKVPVEEIDSDKKKIFTYLPHKDSLKDYLTVEENLENWINISNNLSKKKDIFNSLKFFNMHEMIDNPLNNLSHGQRKKVSLTKLLLTQSKLWILDEPFNGLDVSSVKKCETLLKRHIKSQGSVILSSHINLNIKGSKKFVLKRPRENLQRQKIKFNSWEDMR